MFDNKLLAIRDRHRDSSSQRLGDTNVVNTSPISPMKGPLVRRMISPMSPPLVRRMGETTLDQRRRRASPMLWNGTPLAEIGPQLGAIDLTPDLMGFDSVGWEWRRDSNQLVAYLTTNGKTYTVKVPASVIKKIFNRNLRRCGMADEIIVERPSLNGMFKKLGRGLKKASRRITSAPKRAIKNPGKFIRDSGRDIKKLVKGVGKTAINVASSPIFAGVMTAMAAVPPLTAVGAAGLAAFAAANAVKPAFRALETAIDVGDKLAAKKRVGDYKANLNSMPKGAQNLMKSALQSTAMQDSRPNLGNPRVRYSRGGIVRIQ